MNGPIHNEQTAVNTNAQQTKGKTQEQKTVYSREQMQSKMKDLTEQMNSLPPSEQGSDLKRKFAEASAYFNADDSHEQSRNSANEHSDSDEPHTSLQDQTEAKGQTHQNDPTPRG